MKVISYLFSNLAGLLRYIILFVLLSLFYIPLSAFAAWNYDDASSCVTSTYDSGGAPYYYTFHSPNYSCFTSGYEDGIYKFHKWLGSEPLSIPSDADYVINHIYTDSQCSSVYGASSVATGVAEDGTGSSCSIPPTTDEQCLALNDDYGDEMTMVLDFDPGELTWAGSGSGAGCEFATVPGVSVEVGGKWHVKFEAIGAVEELEGSTDPIEATGPEAPEGGELVSSEDYTLTTDPQTDCQFSNVTFGTETYCYTGTYAPQDVAYPDGSIRVDNPDGSFDIVAPDGTTTEYTADGGIKNPDSAPGTADGESYGDDADGIIGAISSLKKAVNEGFDKLVDNFTEEYDDAADVASVGNAIDTYEQTIENDQTDIAEDFDNEIDGSTAQSVVDMLPSFTGFSCSDIVFSFGERAMTISCDNFTVFRQMFAFLIYCYTAISMVELFFNSSRQKGVA